MKDIFVRSACVLLWCAGIAMPAFAQIRPSAVPDGIGAQPAALRPGFVVGIGDILTIAFWHDERMSREVLVRPDGKISLPLLNDIDAAGFTPEQLAGALRTAAVKYMTEPDVTVSVKEIHSRRVFVVGEVVTPGAIPLTGTMTVLQVLAAAGGLREYADRKHIVVIRLERGQERRFKFNYEDVLKGKNTDQNIMLQPGDTVLVP